MLKSLKGWNFIFLGTSAVVVVMIALLWYQYACLRKFGVFINTHYSAQLSALDAAAHVPEEQVPDSVYSTSEENCKKLKSTFESNTFFSVSFSIDGHHGIRSIKTPREGSSWSRWLEANVGNSSSVCFGKSYSGEPLLIYTRWIPDAPLWRHVRLVFSQRQLEDQMANKTSR